MERGLGQEHHARGKICTAAVAANCTEDLALDHARKGANGVVPKTDSSEYHGNEPHEILTKDKVSSFIGVVRLEKAARTP